MRKNHLRANEQKVIAAAHLFTASAATRLVVSNKQIKKSRVPVLDLLHAHKVSLLSLWLRLLNLFAIRISSVRKSAGVLTYSEKKELVIKYLTLKFADYQLTTGEVGLFPLCEAINEVEKLENNNQLENYYNRNKRRIAG